MNTISQVDIQRYFVPTQGRKAKPVKSVKVNGKVYPNSKAAAQYIYEDSGLLSVHAIKFSIDQYLNGDRKSWRMHGGYTIS
jgi:hypothetical protein